MIIRLGAFNLINDFLNKMIKINVLTTDIGYGFVSVIFLLFLRLYFFFLVEKLSLANGSEKRID
jgi:hypothetical protein